MAGIPKHLRKPHPEITCQTCGKIFTVKAYMANTAKYCSRRCQGIGTRPVREAAMIKALAGKKAWNNQRQIVVCEFCGKEKEFSPSYAKYRRYCSKQCYSKHCKGNGITKYKKIRGRHIHRVIMEQHLGRQLSKEEHIHHINGDHHDNRIENLIIVTNSEHTRLHDIQRHKKRMSSFSVEKPVYRKANRKPVGPSS